jgi:ketosteroid isomerase-like protein
MRPTLPLLLLLAILPATAKTPQALPVAPTAPIEDFNTRLAAATRSMDNAATLALWANDGVSLLPSTPPISGKLAIAAFLTSVTTDLKGASMEKFDLECHDIEVSGNLATEWCTEHQIVNIPGKPAFDGRGKMLLVLRRTPSGEWLLLREMWNQA